MDQSLIEHLLDIKERLATIEAHSSELKEDLRRHRGEAKDQAKKTEAEIAALKAEIDQARGGIRAIKWAIPVVISIVAAVVKYIQ